MANREQKRVTFRADEEKVEYLDWLIEKKNVDAGPGADKKVVRSDLLRGCIDDLIEELEEDVNAGNPNRAVLATAD